LLTLEKCLKDVKYIEEVTLVELSDKLWKLGTLEKIKEAIKKQTNINSLQIRQLNEENMSGFRDGQIVKYAGTITSIKKKYTKRNTIMAFITVEDLYGNAEIVVFDSIY